MAATARRRPRRPRRPAPPAIVVVEFPLDKDARDLFARRTDAAMERVRAQLPADWLRYLDELRDLTAPEVRGEVN